MRRCTAALLVVTAFGLTGCGTEGTAADSSAAAPTVTLIETSTVHRTVTTPLSEPVGIATTISTQVVRTTLPAKTVTVTASAVETSPPAAPVAEQVSGLNLDAYRPKKLGETAKLVRVADESLVAEFAINEIQEIAPEECTNRATEPENGLFLLLSVSAHVASDFGSVEDDSPLFLYPEMDVVTADGMRENDVSTSEAINCMSQADTIPGILEDPGVSYEGYIVLDVSSRSGHIIMGQPSFADAGGWTWEYDVQA